MSVWDNLAATFGGSSTGRDLSSDPFGDVAAAEAQMQAQREALAQQERLANESRAFFEQQSNEGLGYLQLSQSAGESALRQGSQRAGSYLNEGQNRAAGAFGGGYNLSGNALGGAYTQSRSDISGGYDQARGDLGRAYGQASGTLSGAYGQARGDLGRLQGLQGYGAGAAQGIGAYSVLGAQDRTGRMLDQRGGLYGGFENDPGYRFRQQQGEDAINRAASARGGRLSGRTLQELSEFNQGLASQEYGNFAARRQAEAGLAAGSDAQRAGLLQNQAGRSDAAALAAQSNQMGLAQMGYGAQGQLAGLASQYGQQMAGMQGAYGQQMAGYSAQRGQQLAGYASQYGQQMADLHGTHAQNLGDLYTQTAQQQAGNANQLGSNLSNLYSSTGSNMANVAIGVGGNAQGNANNLMGAYQNFAQYGGMAQQAQANSNRDTAAMMMAMFSDERLKEQIETIPSKYEAIGLRGVCWKWNDEAEALGLGDARSTGVIAQEVAEVWPHAVVEMAFGYLGVDYGELDRLVAESE